MADTSEDRVDAAKGIEVIFEKNYPVISGLHTIHLREKNNHTIPNYKTYFVASKSFRYFARKYCEGIKVFSIKSSLLKYTNFSFPANYKEQEKIVVFLTLIDKKINLVNRKIETLKKYKEGLMIWAYKKTNTKSLKLKYFVKNGTVSLGRGEIISKQEGLFPVYSSSSQNNGYFCKRNNYSFDDELVTWSIDGGGTPFYRHKHKFSITNVCGYARINDLNCINYIWLYINFWHSWKKQTFNYTSKAHPSIIENLYTIKLAPIDFQNKIEKILFKINQHIEYKSQNLNKIVNIKKQLLRNLFI